MQINMTDGLAEMDRNEMEQVQGGDGGATIVLTVLVVGTLACGVYALGKSFGWWGGGDNSTREKLPTRNFDPAFALEPLK